MAKKRPKSMVDEIGALETESKSAREVDLLRKKLKAAEELIKKQQVRLEQQSASKYKLPNQRPLKPGRGGHVRVIIPDTHGCFIDGQAAATFLRDLEALQPKEIVMLGDHIDCGGFLAQHHTLGFVASAGYTFEDDVAAANQFLDQVQKAAPRAAIHYLEGNHEVRISRWIITAALRNQQDSAYLLKMFSPESVLHLAKRKIPYYSWATKYHGCRVPGTIRLGKCYFTHGSRHGKTAAQSMLAQFGAPVVFGHIHKMLSTCNRTVAQGEIGAWSPGCLTSLQPLWRNTDCTDWTHGYGVQVVRPDGDFLHINVPIIDGKSYLMQLTGAVK